MKPSSRAGLLLATTAFVLAAGVARAEDPPKPDAAPEAPKTWMSGITLGAQIQGGYVFNPAFPEQRINFGQTLNDRANQPMLNQAVITLQRQIDPKNPGPYEVGFKLQAQYGSDSRYTQALGIFNHAVNNQMQPDIGEASVSMHLPWLTEGGIDVKAGLYPTLLGAETIDPSTNLFYTHSYIFNFGLPLKHTGAYAITHALPWLDVYTGIDTGTNTTFGMGGDNNSAMAGVLGFGLNLLEGNLTVLALTHFGPENPAKLVPNANGYYRYFNDVVVTYKPNDKLTLITEGNWVRESLNQANGFGAAQYASYALSEQVALNGRAEIWRDDKGFFVAAFPSVHGFTSTQLGNPAPVMTARPTTYGAITLGVTYKPTLPAPVAGLLIRPELRYDSSLNNSKPFNNGKDNGAFMASMDFVLQF